MTVRCAGCGKEEANESALHEDPLDCLVWLRGRLEHIRSDVVEECAKAIEADKERVFATGCPSLGEMCIYDVCAITVRQCAAPSETGSVEK